MERMKDLKHRILDHIEESATDLERVNVNELGEFVEMIGVLADAIHHCSEAEYYQAVTEAMGSGKASSTAIKDDLDDSDVLGMLGEEYHSLSPEERRVMKNKVLTILGIK